MVTVSVSAVIDNRRQMTRVIFAHLQYYVKVCLFQMKLLYFKVIKTLCLEYLHEVSNCTLLILLCKLLTNEQLPPGRSLVSSYGVVWEECHLPASPICLYLFACWTNGLRQTLSYPGWSVMHYTPPATWQHLSVTCDTFHRWKGLRHPLVSWRQNLTSPKRDVHVNVWLDSQILRLDHIT
jgi:hypothetical protein